MKLKLNALISTGLFLIGISVAIAQNMVGFETPINSVADVSYQQNHDKIDPTS